jgi:hypothetical protein
MAVLVAGGLVAGQRTARAQSLAPKIPRVVMDVRVMRPNFKPTAIQAGVFGYAADSLPSTARGVAVAGHWYPGKWKTVTFGVGVEALVAKGTSTPTYALGAATGDAAQTVWKSAAPQVSLNFGTGEGWSYLSAGYGVSTFMISSDIYPAPDRAPKRGTVNVGGGARWFFNHHMAFTLDLRFYKMGVSTTAQSSAVAEAASGASSKRFIVSAGTSFR